MPLVVFLAGTGGPLTQDNFISLKARGGKEKNDCEQLLPILFCSVLRYPFFGPLGGQLSRTTQFTPEVTQAVHCGFTLSQRTLFRRHSSHLSSRCQHQRSLDGRR